MLNPDNNIQLSMLSQEFLPSPEFERLFALDNCIGERQRVGRKLTPYPFAD